MNYHIYIYIIVQYNFTKINLLNVVLFLLCLRFLLASESSSGGLSFAVVVIIIIYYNYYLIIYNTHNILMYL